jgi:1,4-alpha-glucan branching enzyme
MQQLVTDLNHLYTREPALHRNDFEPSGFDWIDCNDHQHSTLSYLRRGDGQTLVVVLNFTPEPRSGYAIGVPESGRYRVLLNSDSGHYGGANLGNIEVVATDQALHGQPCSVVLDLPPLAGLILQKA